MTARCRDCLCVTLMDLYILGERWPLILSFDIIIYSIKEKKLKNLLCREEVVKGVLQQQCLQALVALCLFVMLAVVGTNILWINPDCGLKIRKYPEVVPALTSMVSAAKQLRAKLASAK